MAASSLRERIYAAEGTYGILIYTGSSDAEGTLGGLIEVGRRIHEHIQAALGSDQLQQLAARTHLRLEKERLTRRRRQVICRGDVYSWANMQDPFSKAIIPSVHTSPIISALIGRAAPQKLRKQA